MAKQGYSAPSLYEYRLGDTSKAWYIGFRYTNPETKERKPFQIRGNINYFHLGNERRVHGLALQNAVEQSLKDGRNPFSEEFDVYIERITLPPEPEPEPIRTLNDKTFNEAIDFALSEGTWAKD
ncbi:MAG TPA: hypothetical protein VGB84_08670, partial [Arachidicoccus sp.]